MKKAFKLLSAVLAVLMVLAVIPFSVSAANSGSCGASTSWSYNTTTETLTVYGSGAVTDPQWNTLGFGAKKLVVSSGVTSICSNAFDYCKELTDADIPSSVTSIGSDAFYLKMVYTQVGTGNQGDDAEVQVSYVYPVKFRCEAGSYAESYAIANGITVVYGVNPNTPAAPVAVYVTATSVTLEAVPGNEYSMDGVNFQASNIFSGLNPVTQYNFYQRVAESGGYLASAVSPATTVTTGKAPNEEVPEASVSEVTSSSVTLTAVDGAEYSIDGETYQTSNVFGGLNFAAEYTFYVRYAETATTSASEAATVTVTTEDFDGVGDVNDDKTVDNLDLVAIKKYAVGFYQDVMFERVDCDGDKQFTVLDIIRLKNYLADNEVVLG